MKHQVILKWVLALSLLLGAYVFFAHRTWRLVAMFNAMQALSSARHEFLATGQFTNYSKQFGVSFRTNIAFLSGTNYWCFLLADGPDFENEGSLGITSNGALVWFGRNGRAKMVDVNYRPPWFAGKY